MVKLGWVPLLLLGLVPGPGGGSLLPTGEEFRYPATGTAYRVLRNPESGLKVLEGPDGTRFPSVESVVLAEEAALPPLRRVLAPSLWALAESPPLAAQPVKVLLVLRSQPVHDAAGPIRERVRGELAPKFARLRAILRSMGPHRSGGNGDGRQVGDLIAEENRKISAEDRAEIAAIREDVKDRMHGMRHEILAAARPRAEAEQDAVAAFVEAIPGAEVRGRSLVLSAVAATVPAGALRLLVEGLPAVACVFEDADVPLALDRAVRNIGGKTWWDAGYDGGSGVGVGNFDTGVDDTHPALTGHVVSKNFTGLDAMGNDSSDDINGHGTHIAGIMGSRDSLYRGVAPGCTVFNGRSGVYGYMFTSAMMAGGDWAADNGCDIFNNSIGSYGNSTGNYSHALYNDAASAEIAVSVAAAAANYGFTTDGLAPNSTGFNGFCVTNYAPGFTSRSQNIFNDSSSHGPCSDGRHKPDLAAPGTSPWSCAYDWEGANNDFVQMGGTSMSSPMVAGSLALLYDYGASWTPEGMKALLLASTWNESPTPKTWDTGWGFGALDLAAAFANRAGVYEGSFTSTGPTTFWLQGPALAAGEKVALCWNRQVVWNNASVPTSYKSIVDLDLEVYDLDGNLLGKSSTVLDSVERILVASAVPGTLIKVVRAGAFPAGQTSVDWAVATGGGAALAPAIVKPFGTLSLAGGAPAATESYVPVTLSALSGNDVVTEMRLRNPGDAFSDWAPLQASFFWTLAPGAGSRTLEAEVRDAQGLASETFSDSIVVDPDPPAGTFTLSGGREYLMPWETLTADLAGDDGTGSGVADFRIRWGSGAPWSAWLPAAGGSLPLARPPVEAAAAEGEFRDLAGNVSGITGAAIRLVPADSPLLARSGRFRGRMLPGGMGGSLRIALLPGDELAVHPRLKGSRRAPAPPLSVDLWNPVEARVVEGAAPRIDGFPAAVAGDHWIVLRPGEAVPDDGLPLSVQVKVRRPKSAYRVDGVAVPVEGLVSIPFLAVDGMELKGTLDAPVGPPLLRNPEGAAVPLPGEADAKGNFRIRGAVLLGGTGEYRIEADSPGTFAYRLRLRDPRPAR